jgi:hypothetical protein
VFYRHRWTRELAYRLIPFYQLPECGEGGGTSATAIVELEKQITFDALTPWHDHPMRSEEFRGIIESAGFDILHFFDPVVSPLLATARRRVTTTPSASPDR